MSYNQQRYKSLVDTVLTTNNNGWKLDLFVSIDDDYICAKCKNICKNAVSLVCEFEREEDEHKDEDIKLYCESCLKNVINSTGNKCPISNHSNPKFALSRILRRKIMKENVLCPNSMEYQQKINGNKNTDENNNNPSDEGRKKPNFDIHGFTHFRGTLSQLIEQHIHGCIERKLFSNNNENKSSSNILYFQMIEDLKQKNDEMHQEIELLKNIQQKEIAQIKQEMKAMKIDYNNNLQSLQQKIISMEKMQEMMQNEMQMKLETNKNKNNNNRNSLKKQSLIQISLGIHSCRKAFNHKFHPRYLLQSGFDDYYGSVSCTQFRKNEKDWIIFQMKDNHQLCIPTQVKIRNHGGISAISRIVIYIGSVVNNKWA